MCKAGTHIKLCTCAGKEIDEARSWNIFRVDPNSDEILEGTIEPPVFTNLGMYMEQKLLEDLNNEDVFDFNYEAKNGDELVIFLDDHSFAFEYKDGKFRIAPDDYSFTPRLNVLEGTVHIVNRKS